MEVLPGQRVATWDALRWFGGERWPGIFSGEPASVLGAPERSEIELFRDHEFAVAHWSQDMRDLDDAVEKAQAAETANLQDVYRRRAESLTREVQEDENQIRRTRKRLRGKDLIPLPLPRALTHLVET